MGYTARDRVWFNPRQRSPRPYRRRFRSPHGGRGAFGAPYFNVQGYSRSILLIDPLLLVVLLAGVRMSRQLVTVEPEQDLDEALALMARHQVRRLPVVEAGRLVGMLAQADVALEAKEKKVGETIEEISKPTSIERE